jgi:hypothetical protein
MPRHDGCPQALGNSLNVVDLAAHAQEPVAVRGSFANRHRERVLRRLVLDRKEFQVLIADGDQPICSAPRLVATSGDRAESVTFKQFVGRAGEIANRDHDVIDLVHGVSLPPVKASGKGRQNCSSARDSA